ncbi:MAG: HIT family protein [Campylobacterales bacterium]|jgi:ATP adenylyltransferase
MTPESSNTHCLFCNLPEDVKVVDENDLAVAFYDKFPVTRYHTLIIPRRHVADYFELNEGEIGAIHALLQRRKERLEELDDTITGFNVGVNIGRDAGQTIFHVHVHLIPRRGGDMPDPKGGVRGVIPEKQKYG